jgi:hypothetical protein
VRRSAFLFALTLACGGDDEPECPGVGCFADTGSASSATTTTASSTTTETTTTTTTTASESSSESSTGAPPCEGADCPALAECFGLGVWESCAQYCEALEATCVAGGCDGATVVYYGDVDACTAMRSSGSSDQGCDEAFAMGGGNSFGRCCCD